MQALLIVYVIVGILMLLYMWEPYAYRPYVDALFG